MKDDRYLRFLEAYVDCSRRQEADLQVPYHLTIDYYLGLEFPDLVKAPTITEDDGHPD